MPFDGEPSLPTEGTSGGDRLAGRLEDGSGEGIPVSVGEELRRPARRRRQCVA